MPRLARLDAPGILHHVIIRGIEGKNIFRDTTDKKNLVNRLDQLIPQSQTSCYAWVLLSNHAHFLLRSGPDGLVSLMQRLLTGYAVSFNRRHKRHRQLFQNRYKSIERFERRYELKRRGYDMTRVAERVAELVGIAKEEIFQKGRQKKGSDARGLFCYWCASELGLPQTELARELEMTVSGIGYAVRRGEIIAARDGYTLIDSVN